MADPFASVAQTYDIMVDWPSRLARERPFFERLSNGRPIDRVLDVGCGTGHHSRMFAEMGAEVIGLDPSEAMLQQAQELTEGVNPQFVLGGFTEIPELPGHFDFIAVLGNTLAYAKHAADLTLILRRMRRVLAPGGRLCLQLVNYDNILSEGSRWLPVINRTVGEKEYLFLREYRRMGQRVEFTVITLTRDEEWQRSVERSLHFAITGEILLKALRRVGFTDVQLYADYHRTPYDPATAPSLVALAEIG